MTTDPQYGPIEVKTGLGMARARFCETRHGAVALLLNGYTIYSNPEYSVVAAVTRKAYDLSDDDMFLLYGDFMEPA